ncbi:MAG: L-serine ammonia-lyase, iron-sulfur-dependent subunit beta [Oscillospiraceae bacterium]|nr:L-serine ammonia-lyase, iron-sulfur-dependent subunit beta [bacterium]MDY4182072.1 L-serine ammonia-lyase, iron-sulfur-dependent subunit beta [Pseudoflavonifractor sp.]MDY5100514.1 L-serine ammonia-lyase, iron-sulfur-dependent subunit beta [Oscillospiraceae bacterium]
MSLFDILGPVMVGPSSSHTAGAVRMGLVGRQLLGGTPATAHIVLHGSFAATGTGHGTDRALIAGLLGMEPDDERIPMSFALARDAGMEFTFERRELRNAHPNTALLSLTAPDGSHVSLQCASTGGGRILVTALDGAEVSFSGEHNTLIIRNEDRPGMVSLVSSLLADAGVNIATLQLCRDKRGGSAAMVIEVDQSLSAALLDMLGRQDGVSRATYIHVKK